LDAGDLPFPDNSIERIDSYHMVEHIPREQFVHMLSEWNRVLVPSGTLVFELPDFDKCVQEYLDTEDGEYERVLLEFVFGGQRHSTDVHYWGWNEERLRSVLEDAGYGPITFPAPEAKQTEVAPCLRVKAHA
jgi:predicted SAM-dependent methyltransferase